MRKLDTLAKEYLEQVGYQVPAKLLANSFWQAVDEHTLELAENKDMRFDGECYKKLRELALQRFERKQARCPASTKEGLAAVDEQSPAKEDAQNGGQEEDNYCLDSTKGKGKGKT